MGSECSSFAYYITVLAQYYSIWHIHILRALHFRAHEIMHAFANMAKLLLNDIILLNLLEYYKI